MKKFVLLFTLIMTLYACKETYRHNTNFEAISNVVFLQEINDSTKTTIKILDKFLPSVINLSKVDTSSYYYGYDLIDEDTITRQVLIGKFIDRKKIIATEINIKDTTINFFYLNKNKWELIGSEKTNISVFRIDFQDLDGNGNNEIITSTSRNMNGNTWQEVYYCSDKANTVKYAGSFSTDYVINKKRQIEETYEGSWYMDHSKTLYEWRQEKLVPIKQIILAHATPVSENSKVTFEYYENPTNNVDGLKLKFKEPYNDSEKLSDLWNSFFEEQ